MNSSNISRRALLKGLAATAAFGLLPGRSDAAQFRWKMATGQEPTHPVNVRAAEAIARIRKETDGGLDIKLYPAAQLGTDKQLIAQTRLGGIQIMNMASSVLANTIPAAGIVNIGYAFLDPKAVWSAVDGALGSHIAQEISQHDMHQIGVSWENGFRNVTSGTKPVTLPADLHNMKIRVPDAPILSSLFAAFGAAPTSMDFSEVYTSLENHVVDGQENPLPIIYTAKLYDVQKYLSMTQHAWDGYLIISNKPAFMRLPKKWQDIVSEAFSDAGRGERADIARLSDSLKGKLATKGMKIVDVHKSAFRDALIKTDYYPHWKKKFGDTAWSLLEKTSGSLE
ncbi:TRAP transporter substrate-binding protein [Paralcaligenes sp. KSB-10]|uniref:TRAP transporter substrate-binding protein n=1 Tax=Paralcaligenes sp. KSB-10 TaxID=2901142 RepID=UPI001E46FDC7|nr:TRAP transporter substrate-binding protein [Paralcaligenes sp. KSB-10]UHL62460.1 TRAP transporter substrate-binding protein [Paralcaligenes sp. KSB-10]